MKKNARFEKLSSIIRTRVWGALTTGARGILPPTLDDTYRRILLRIPDEDVPFAAKALACFAAAWTTLSVEQLAEAVIVEPDRMQIDHGERFMDPEDLVAVLGGLAMVELRDGWRVIALAHYSVLEYLTSERILDADLTKSKFNMYLHDADGYFASICKTYLTLGILRTRAFRSEYNLDTYNTEYPLFTFACSGIGHQVKKIRSLEIQKKLELSLARVLYDEPYLWSNLKSIFFKRNDWYSPMFLFMELEMYSAAVTGIALGIHPKRQVRAVVSAAPSLGSPFGSAVGETDYEMVRFTLYHAACDKDYSKYRILESTFPLVSAVRDGDYDLVKLFIDNGFDDRGSSGYRSLKCNECCMALHRAVYTHHPQLEIIQALLDNGCDINSVNLNGTVLTSAVMHSYRHRLQPTSNLELTEFLLSAGTKLDPVYSREDGRLFSLEGRLLVRTAWSSSLETVQLLLDRGASYSIPIRNSNLVLPLYYVCPKVSSEEIADIYFIVSPVAAAAYNPTFSDKILSILVSLNVDINGLDCIIGWGTNDSFRLEYCLDYFETLFPLYRAESHKGFTRWNEDVHRQSINALLNHGGKVLPRNENWAVSPGARHFNRK
ncbi:hypothetical protein Clacol_006019 [Clathrus columnatus]|uniref:Uncharacterized protein n=1 Tax=Clathrus columnatus TaxID=1419009 RepID=A0AAV5AH21_9AGAM|nr:hypothetical protein Clacol_006019 [Clathrus columnatus]